MRVLLTGHQGYIGAVASSVLADAGHDLVGLDSGLYAGCDFGEAAPELPTLPVRDVRDVTAEHLEGFDAVVHLAAISNDPIGELNSDTTYEVNHRASAELAATAKSAGVGRFVFSSSCSLYGAAGDEVLDETAGFDPVTAYGESKVLAEQDISPLADDSFTPTYLRNATVYGVSPRLRGDVVVNNLAGVAYCTGHVLMKSDGTPWRPLVHVKDVCRAVAAVLEAPRELVHDEAFNVATEAENYRISEVAEIVKNAIPGTEITYAEDAGPDLRCYRVTGAKLADRLPDATPRHTVPEGVAELVDAFAERGLREGQIESSRFTRLRRIDELRSAGKIDDRLRWVNGA
jgi:nucleoside-diphosphate-sugar epimerase